jgi:DNA-binding response OmpR family regulator
VRPVVLLVARDVETRGNCAELLRSHGFEPIEAGTAAHALAIARDLRLDLIILDMTLPDRDGLDLAADIRTSSARPDVPILAFIGEWAAKQADRAEELAVEATLMNPSPPGPLLSEVYRALKTSPETDS